MLHIEHLWKGFHLGTEFENKIFEDFSIDIESQTATALIGSNGCGKSTLLNLIAGTLAPESGSIFINETNVTPLLEADRAKYFGRVYQSPTKGVAPSLTLLENLALADKKMEKFGLRSLIRKERIEYYRELVKTLQLGLENQLNTRVRFLSGGQQQSVSLLLATMKNPELLLLDEHTAALDPKTSAIVMEKTMQLVRDRRMTTVMITHNMEDATRFADRIVMLDRGKVVLDVPAHKITAQELHQLYIEKQQLQRSA